MFCIDLEDMIEIRDALTESIEYLTKLNANSDVLRKGLDELGLSDAQLKKLSDLLGLD